MNATLVCYEVFVMDVSEIILTSFIMATIVLAIYLRKDLEEHGLLLWAYVGLPLLIIPGLILIFIDELPTIVMEIVRPTMLLIGSFVIFISTFLAYFRRD